MKNIRRKDHEVNWSFNLRGQHYLQFSLPVQVFETIKQDPQLGSTEETGVDGQKKSPNVKTLGLNKYGTYLLSQAAA
jgi:hypothetical protein